VPQIIVPDSRHIALSCSDRRHRLRELSWTTMRVRLRGRLLPDLASTSKYGREETLTVPYRSSTETNPTGLAATRHT
jgi:hypothetical protein